MSVGIRVGSIMPTPTPSPDRKTHKRSREQKHDKHKKRRKREHHHRIDEDSTNATRDKEKMLARDRVLLGSNDPRAHQQPGASTPSVIGSTYYDVRGDWDSLAFGCQYHAQVPKYRSLTLPRDDAGGQRYFRLNSNGGVLRVHVTQQLTRHTLRHQHATQPGEALALFVPWRADRDTEPLPTADVADEPRDGTNGNANDGTSNNLLAGGAYERTRELNAAVRQRPTDEAAWFALADSLQVADSVLAVPSAAADRRAITAAAERKTEVLRRAVAANPTSEALRMALLRACEAYLPWEDVDREWEHAVAQQPASVALWSALLGRRGAAFGAYMVSAQRQLGARSLRALWSHLEGLRAGGAPAGRLASLEHAIILLLSRAAYVERCSGYFERSTSLLLAAIEISCFAPLPPTTSYATLFDAFEAFWEAEAPRIGEVGGRGWRHWQQSIIGREEPAASRGGETDGDVDGVPSMTTLNAPADAMDLRDPMRQAHATWSAHEERLDRSERVPLAASEAPDAADVDPERVVFAEELRPFLVQLRSHEAQSELFLAMAALLQVAHAHDHLPSSHPLAVLASLHAETPEALLPMDDAVASAPKSSDAARRFARAVLTAGCEAFPSDERIARALLATADERTSVRKLARPLLKRSPEALSLWCVYAEAEADCGNAAEAQRVSMSALTLCAPPKGHASPMELLPLGHAAARRELEATGLAAGEAPAVTRALCFLVCAFVPEAGVADTPTRPQVLMARRGFEREAQNWLPPSARPPTCPQAPSGHGQEGGADLNSARVTLLCAFALFEELESGILAALNVHEVAQAALMRESEDRWLLRGAGSRGHEQLIEHWHSLLARHADQRRPPAGRERALYQASLAHFPANGPVLRTLERGGLGSLGRFEIRRLLAAARARHPECPQLWLCSVRFEQSQRRCAPSALLLLAGGGNRAGTSREPSFASVATAPEASSERRVRVLFEDALRRAACAGCPALWRAYLLFEQDLGRHAAACRLLLRAQQQCPGVKSIWTEVARLPMVSFVPSQQLLGAVQLMCDKEIRLRHEPPGADEAPSVAASATQELAQEAAPAADLAEREPSRPPIMPAGDGVGGAVDSGGSASSSSSASSSRSRSASSSRSTAA